MSREVWKYSIGLLEGAQHGGVTLEIPYASTFLCAREQNGSMAMWFDVIPDSRKEKMTFQLFGTGHPIPDNINAGYVGTGLFHDGALVLHLYRVRPTT